MKNTYKSFAGVDVQVTSDGKKIEPNGMSLSFNDTDKCLTLLTTLGEWEIKPKEVSGKEVTIEFKTENGDIRDKMICKVGKYEGFSFGWSANDLAVGKLLKFSLESVVDQEEE